MQATLIGYFPKRTQRRPAQLNAPQVEEIASASNCISSGPPDWIDLWQHNQHWLYDSATLARQIVQQTQAEEPETYDLYAFKEFPVVIEEGEVHPQLIHVAGIEPLGDGFVFLGYDAVSRSQGNAFECSPLSCNGAADHLRTNRYCLFDSPEDALAGAKRFSQGHYEPGPYCIVDVYRFQSS